MKRQFFGCVVLAVAALSACTADDSATVDPATMVRRSFAVIDEHWLSPERPWRGPPPRLASMCGDPRSGMSIAGDGMDKSAVSPVRSFAIDTPDGLRPRPQGPVVRIGAVRYADDATAERAVRSITGNSFQRCTVDATRRYLETRGDEWRDVPPPTAAEFTTTSTSDDGTALLRTSFDEEAIGGHDNTEALSIAVARSGRLVITVVSATSSQSPDAAADVQFVKRAAARLKRYARSNHGDE